MRIGSSSRSGNARHLGRRGVTRMVTRAPDDGVLWDARFDLLPLSTSANAAQLRAALLSMGLTLTRASVATVQVSPTALVASGIGVDDPRVGNGGFGPGLVVEESRANVYWNSIGLGSNIEGNVAVAAPTASAGAVGPDGATNSRRLAFPAVPAAGNASVSYRSSTGTAATWAVSTWVRGTVGGEQAYLMITPDGVAYVEKATGVLTTAWQRVSQTGVLTAVPWYTQVGTDRRSAGQAATPAQTIDWACTQLEVGGFPTELIATTTATATRAADRLVVPATRVVVGGRIGMELRFIPKGARARYTPNPRLLVSQTSADGVNMPPATGALNMSAAGGVFTTPSGMSWNAGDVVDLWMEWGGGVLKSVAKYRVNGGAVVTLGVSGAPQGKFAATGNIDLLNNAGAQQLTSWVQRVRTYLPGRRPAWAA